MGYIRGYTFNTVTGTQATSEMPAHQANDLILFMCGSDGGTGGAWPTPTEDAYTTVPNTNNQASAVSTAAFYFVATGSSHTAPTSTQSASDQLVSYIVIIADIDTADPINISQYAATASGTTHTAPATTTDEDNTLNIWWQFNDGTRYPSQPPGVMGLDIALPQSSAAQGGVCWTFQQSLGSAITPVFELLSSDSGHINTICINSANSSPVIAPCCDPATPPSVIIHPLRGSGASSAFGGGSVDPTADLAAGLGPNSEVFNYVAMGNNGFAGVYSGAAAIGTDTPSSSSAANVWGAVWNLSAGNIDISGKKISFQMQAQSLAYFAALDSVSNGGYILGFRSVDASATGTAYRFFNVAAINSKPAPLSHISVVIDIDSTTLQWGSDKGTETTPAFDSSDVNGIFLACKKSAGSVGSTDMRMTYSECHEVQIFPIIGGGASVPAKLTTFVDSLYASRVLTISNQGGSSTKQVFSLQPLQVGNGSDSVYFEQDSASLEFPATADEATRNIQYNVGANWAGITFYAVSGDTISFTNSAISGVTAWDFAIHASATSAATWNFSGLNIINADVVLRDVFTAASGMSFIDCPTFTANSADLSGGCTFDNTLVTVTSEAELTDISNGTFKNRDGGGESAILITGNQTGSWSDPNLTVSGNTFDIEYTGTTNFSIQSVNALSVNNSSSGVLTVVTPVLSFQIDSSETGSFIQIFTTATQTVLASTTGSSLNYPFTGTVVVDYVVQKSGFLPQRFVGVTLTDSTTAVSMVTSREYDAAHGLVYNTDASWSRSLNQLTVPTFGVTGQGVFSLILDSFIAETTLYNTAFNIEMDGTGSLYLTNAAEGNADSSIENLTGCGCAYLTSAQVTTALWSGVLSVGIATGFQGEYQQIDGTTTTDARATGIFNELIKVFGDIGHGNFDYTSHLVLKYQPNTYRESRSDIIDSYSLTVLEPTLYIVALEPEAIGITAGDPAINITIVDHTAAPLSIGGKNFDFEIQDNGANDGNAMLREVNYNLSQDAAYQGRDPFNWPEMILLSGSTYESIYGIVEGLAGLHGVYVSRAAADHPSFTRFQSNDGTYYVKPITANAAINNIVTGSRLRIYNETTATETENSIIAGTSFSDSYTEGTTYTAGDVITVYLTQTAGVTAQLPLSAVVVASSTGWTVLAAQVSDDVYDGYGLNGSAITKFAADYINDEVDLTIASNFSGEELYAWWAYNLTTSQGISDFFGGITAQDAANLLINNSIVSIYLDNTTTTNVIQTDNIRVYRADGNYPVKNPTSGGGGIDVVWRDRVFIAETGVSGLTPSESTELFKNTDILLDTGTTLPAQIAALPTSDATEANQTTIINDIAALNDFDPASDTVANVTLVATTTTNADMRGTEGANTVAPDNSTISAIDAKVDIIDSNVDDNKKVLNNKSITNAATGKQQIFDDDNTTVLKEAILYDDADGATVWDGTNPINRRDKLE